MEKYRNPRATEGESIFNNKICSHHDIAEILLRLALNTNQSINQSTGKGYLSVMRNISWFILYIFIILLLIFKYFFFIIFITLLNLLLLRCGTLFRPLHK